MKEGHCEFAFPDTKDERGNVLSYVCTHPKSEKTENIYDLRCKFRCSCQYFISTTRSYLFNIWSEHLHRELEKKITEFKEDFDVKHKNMTDNEYLDDLDGYWY
jgi:hypothetical protein